MKLTRKSFNRRIFVFGILIFCSISLVSTGFATWVMSKNANTKQDGEIVVGTITDGSIAFEENSVKISDTFRFNPKFKDTTGYIQYRLPEGVVDENSNEARLTAENLSVTISGTITPSQYFDSLTIKMDELSEGIIEAANNNYIVLPDCYNSAVVLKKGDTGIAETSGKINFSYVISFAWGSAFGNMNPSEYLDQVEDDGVTPKFEYEYCRSELIKFRRTLFSLDSSVTDDEVMTYNSSQLKYKISLTAAAIV